MLVLAIYRRNRALLAGTISPVVLNPILFSSPKDDDARATRVVLGERVWLERGPDTLFAAASAPVYLFTLRAADNRRPIGTAIGVVTSMALMLLFFRRMVRLYEEQAASSR